MFYKYVCIFALVKQCCSKSYGPADKEEKGGTGIYHVMLRGINRQDIFDDDEDYMQMTSILRGQSERYDEKGLRLSPFCTFYEKLAK